MQGLKISKMQVIDNPKEDAQIPIIQNGTNYSMPFGTLNKLITQIYEDYDIPNALQQLQIQIESTDAATAKAKDTAAHPGYVDNDGYYYKWNVETKTYEKTDVNLKGVKGDTFTFDDLTEEQKASLMALVTDAATNANAAADACNTATTKANDATAAANTATTNANAATEAAVTAKQNADAATAAATAATGLANTAASLANQKATLAQTAADAANTAATNARFTNLSDVKHETYSDGDIPMFNGKNGRFEKMNFAVAEDILTYGVEWDSAVSSPDGTRIGNPTLHRTLPVHNMMKGVLLADDGTENLVLPDNSWIEQTRDGSMGQVMVKIPNYYFKCEQDGTKFRFKISTTKLAGYSTFFDESIPYVYCSAYEAGLDRTNLKLTSIVNNSTQYRGGDNNSSWDGTYRSLLNMPATNINSTNFRTYARNRNTNNTYWNDYIYTIHVMISWLFYTEYATLNSQKDYNAQLDANGYKQGGLGKGVSDIPDWAGYNGNNPFVQCGATDSLGNRSGVVNYNVIASDGSSTYYTAQVPRYRGVENPFGHLLKWTDGINIKEDGTTRTAYVTTHPSKFSDTAYDEYENRGTISHSKGWTTRMLLGAFGDLIPTAVDGSSSTFWCDYYWVNTTPNLYGALLGGIADYGAHDGFGCVNTIHVPSDAYAFFGSRLCFVKLT